MKKINWSNMLKWISHKKYNRNCETHFINQNYIKIIKSIGLGQCQKLDPPIIFYVIASSASSFQSSISSGNKLQNNDNCILQIHDLFSFFIFGFKTRDLISFAKYKTCVMYNRLKQFERKSGWSRYTFQNMYLYCFSIHSRQQRTQYRNATAYLFCV